MLKDVSRIRVFTVSATLSTALSSACTQRPSGLAQRRLTLPFMRATTFQFRTAFSAGLLPPLRQTASCVLVHSSESIVFVGSIELSDCTFFSWSVTFSTTLVNHTHFSKRLYVVEPKTTQGQAKLLLYLPFYMLGQCQNLRNYRFSVIIG